MREKSLLRSGLSRTTDKIESLSNQRSLMLEKLCKVDEFSSLLVKEVERRVLEIKNEISSLESEKERLSEKLVELENSEPSTTVLSRTIKAGERLVRNNHDLATIRGWYRELFERIEVDFQSRRLKVHWRESISTGKQIMPFKADLPCGSRQDAVEEALGVSGRDLKTSELYTLAVEEKLTSAQIARKLGVSRSTVSKYLKKFKIPTFKAGENQVRRRGVRYGTTPTRKRKTLKVSEDQRIITACRAWREQGKSYREIAQILNTQGTPTKTGKGKWHGKTIHQILGKA